MFAYFETCEGDVVIDVAFTDRHGGVSGSLDLADEVDDASQSRRDENIDILAYAVARGAEAVDSGHWFERTTDDLPADRVDGPPGAWGRRSSASTQDPVDDRDADAMVTSRVGQALLVRAADCVPVVLADP